MVKPNPINLMDNFVRYVRHNLGSYESLLTSGVYIVSSLDFVNYCRSIGVNISDAKLRAWFSRYIEDSLRREGFNVVSRRSHGKKGLWIVFKIA